MPRHGRWGEDLPVCSRWRCLARQGKDVPTVGMDDPSLRCLGPGSGYYGHRKRQHDRQPDYNADLPHHLPRQAFLESAG